MAILNTKQKPGYPQQTENVPEDLQIPTFGDQSIDPNAYVDPNGLPQTIAEPDSSEIPQALAEEADPAKKLLAIQQSLAPQEIVKDIPKEKQSSDEQRLQQLQNDAIQQDLASQRQGISQNEALVNQTANTWPQFDLTPKLALIDQWTGSHLADHYKAPPTSDEQAAKVLAMKDILQKQRKDLSTEEVNMLKNRIAQTQKQDLLTERADRAEYNRVVNKLDSDPQATQAVGVFNSLSNAYSNFVNSDVPTVGQMNELDQAIRNTLAIRGTGGVDERQRSFLEGLDKDITAKLQYWTSNPQSAEAGAPAMAAHLKNVAGISFGEIQKHAQQRYDYLLGGHDEMWKRHPEWKTQIDAKISTGMGQFTKPVDKHIPRDSSGRAITKPNKKTAPPSGLTAAEKAELDALNSQAGQ